VILLRENRVKSEISLQAISIKNLWNFLCCFSYFFHMTERGKLRRSIWLLIIYSLSKTFIGRKWRHKCFLLNFPSLLTSYTQVKFPQQKFCNCSTGAINGSRLLPPILTCTTCFCYLDRGKSHSALKILKLLFFSSKRKLFFDLLKYSSSC
jgi:hypothetical protein